MKQICMIIMAFMALSASFAMAEQAILVPPDLVYPKGGEDECADSRKKECVETYQCQKLSHDRIALMMGELGRSIYFSLGTGLRQFNERPGARQQGVRFRVKALAYPSCRNYSKIKKFYRMASVPGFVNGLFGKHDVEVVIWADFPSAIIRKCLSENVDSCRVPLKLSFSTKTELFEKEIILEFDAGQRRFTRESCNLVSSGVEDLVGKTFLSEEI